MTEISKEALRPVICLKCRGPLVYGSNRGLCSFCYNKVLRHIKLGVTTWEAQIRKGHALRAMTREQQMIHMKTRPRGGRFKQEH